MAIKCTEWPGPPGPPGIRNGFVDPWPSDDRHGAAAKPANASRSRLCRPLRVSIRVPRPGCRRLVRSLVPWLVLLPCWVLNVGCEDETYQANLEKLGSMPPAELASLERARQQYLRLDAAEQDRRLRLHREIMRQDNAESLLLTASKFQEWLRTLNISERMDLLRIKDVDKFVAQVKRLRDRQEEMMFGSAGQTALPQQDYQQFSDWVDKFIHRHDDSLRRFFGRRIRAFDRISRRLQPYFMYLAYASRDREHRLFDRRDVEDVRGFLSAEAQSILDELNKEEQIKLLAAWVQNACNAKIRPPVTDQQLYQFFQSLPPEQRQKYDDMSPRDWRRNLEQAYYRSLQFN